MATSKEPKATPEAELAEEEEPESDSDTELELPDGSDSRTELLPKTPIAGSPPNKVAAASAGRPQPGSKDASSSSTTGAKGTSSKEEERKAATKEAELGTAPQSLPTPSLSSTALPGCQWSSQVPPLSEDDKAKLRVHCAIWNLHGTSAPEDVSEWIILEKAPHVYVIGTCECEHSIERSLIWSSKARWEQRVTKHLGEDYRMFGSHNMSAIHIMVFIHKQIWKYCWGPKTGQVATGFANLVGNKGGTQVSFNVGHTSLLFINAHLPAHEKKMDERTQSLRRILMDSPIRGDKEKDKGIHEEFNRVFFMGDLNARVGAKYEKVKEWLSQGAVRTCLERDQLRPLLDGVGEEAGLWSCFDEAEITFPPTYKFDPGTDEYDTSKKRRGPSWTDRILWKREGQHVHAMAYNSVTSMKSSDHRPVYGQFEVDVDVSAWQGPPKPERRNDAGSAVCAVQ
mmetsp:Transcript_60833/g.144972  ORF Transcript_60833/g.144972 Transcript_60833/m.144972 type:complete len:454 (-) Transcript_60833:24-1385(-)